MLGEVDRGFDEGAEADQAAVQLVDAARGEALEGAGGGTVLGDAAGLDDGEDGLGLGEVYAAGQEGAAGELARLGDAGAALDEGVEEHPQQGRRAEGVDLGHVLPRVGARGAHQVERGRNARPAPVQAQAGLPGAVPGQRGERCRLGEQALEERECLGAAQAHDGTRRGAGGGRDRDNRVVEGVHGPVAQKSLRLGRFSPFLE